MSAVPDHAIPSVRELQEDFDLNERMARFVQELPATGFNQTEAAKRAGYAESNAHSTGSRLMKNDKVARARGRDWSGRRAGRARGRPGDRGVPPDRLLPRD